MPSLGGSPSVLDGASTTECGGGRSWLAHPSAAQRTERLASPVPKQRVSCVGDWRSHSDCEQAFSEQRDGKGLARRYAQIIISVSAVLWDWMLALVVLAEQALEAFFVAGEY